MISAIIQESACPLPLDLLKEIYSDSSVSEADKKIQEMRKKIYFETVDEEKDTINNRSNCQFTYLPYLFPNYYSPWLPKPEYEYPRLCRHKFRYRGQFVTVNLKAVYSLQIWKLYWVAAPPGYPPFQAVCLWNPNNIIK